MALVPPHGKLGPPKNVIARGTKYVEYFRHDEVIP